MAASAIRAGPYSPSMLALAVLGGQVAVTILGMRSEFDRYHLPMALLGAISAAVMLHWIAVRTVPAVQGLLTRRTEKAIPAMNREAGRLGQ
jgi:hypothetical protein